MAIAHRYIACTRMYNVCERVANLWDELTIAVARESGVDLELRRHPFPENILDIWKRPDLGLVFICGRAFVLGGLRHKAIAAPLRLRGKNASPSPVYGTHILVREDSPFTCCEDIIGRKIGWTAVHSHSGYFALKHLFAPLTDKCAETLFRNDCGPLHTPVNCLHTLRARKVDAVPMDSFCCSLLRRNAPDMLTGVKIVATTQDYPIPFLAASTQTDQATCDALYNGLLAASSRPDMAPVLEALCIAGFTRPDVEAYRALAGPEEITFL